MKLVHRISLLFFLLLGLSLAATVLAIWSFHVASNHVRQVNATHTVYSNILSLKSHTYQLFKQYGDAIMIGDLDEGRGESELITAIRNDVRAARSAISSEIEFYGDEELEELQLLATIELKIERLIEAFKRVPKNEISHPPSINWATLSRILESDIDKDFHGLISTALKEEEREVKETIVEVTQEAEFYQTIALVFAALELLLTAGCVVIVIRTVGRPANSLLSGIRTFGDGNQDHRIMIKGGGEIAEIAHTFNMMAQRISERTENLTSENRALEDSVAERTRQLEKLVEELKKSESNRQRMLADVSHELRTPLTIIQGEADIALRGGEKPAEVYCEALTRARDAARHTSHLVDDLLFIARNESGEVRLKIDQIDLNELIEEIRVIFCIEVSYITDLITAPMRGDPDRLRQTLLVLLENARHHGGDKIVIRLLRTPTGYCAAIEDNGPGMTDEEKEKAFERFFRGSNAAEHYREGLGLGLPVAQSIAAAHGGAIELSDRQGGGLVATLLLPIRPTLKAVA